MNLSRELCDLLANADTPGPASLDDIRDAEVSLETSFPPSYHQFLEIFGAAVGVGVDLAGLFVHEDPDRPPYWQHVVVVNQQVRRASRGSIPNTHILFCDDGMDHSFYMDRTIVYNDGESPVVVLGPGRDDVLVARSFDEFARRWIRNDLDY